MMKLKYLTSLSCALSLFALGNIARADSPSAVDPSVTAGNSVQPERSRAQPIVKKRKVLSRKIAPRVEQSTESEAVVLEASREYIDRFKKIQQLKEQERGPKSVLMVDDKTASQLELAADASLESIEKEPGVYGFVDSKTGAILKNESINFSQSFYIKAQVQNEDVTLTVLPLEIPKNPAQEFAFDEKPFIASMLSRPENVGQMSEYDSQNKQVNTLSLSSNELQENIKNSIVPKCFSTALYLNTKNLNNYIFPTNNYKARGCKSFTLYADGGILNLDNGMMVHLSTVEQKDDYLIKLDILENGWSKKQQELIYGQPAQLILVDRELNIKVAPQVSNSTFHYAKTKELGVENFKTTSPFVFRAPLDKRSIYRAFTVTSQQGRVTYWPTNLYIENLDAEYNLSPTRLRP